MKLNRTLPFILAVCFIGGSCSRKAQQQSGVPFRIIASDAGFQAPDAVPIGMRHIIFENRGPAIHEAMLVKLPRGMAAQDYRTAVKNGSLFPKGALDYSGPGLMSPGEMTEMWVRLDPGEYVLICWNHSKSTPVHPFSVRYPIVDDEPPAHDVVLRLLDYRFELQGTLHKGAQVIRVETVGPSMHEADIFRLHSGKTVADLKRWRKENFSPGAAPADALGGALDSHDITRVVWLRKIFIPGHYVFHCEMPVTTGPEAMSGQELTHADLGMVQEFNIE
jgi:hypothetical protein